MTLNAKPRMDVVRHEDKEARLRDFVAAHFANRTQHSEACWLLVARSPESPVVLALTKFAPEISRSGIVIRIILAGLKPIATETIEHNAIGFAADVRIARDARLLDAHEQLYLDTTTSWIGDCMRREPARRDAYECHAAGCVKTAHWTRISFERLWHVSEPTVMHRGAAVARETESQPAVDPPAFAAPAAEPEAASTAVGSTRH